MPHLKVDKTSIKLKVQEKYPKYICFEHCKNSDHPKESNGIRALIDTLVDFSDSQRLHSRSVHNLSKDGTNPKVKKIIETYSEPIYSVDVGKRHGHLGNYRLLYYRDPNNPELAKIVSLYIDWEPHGHNF